MQARYSITYFSHVLTEKEQLKPTYEREIMVIVMAIQKWPQYLLCRRFVLTTKSEIFVGGKRGDLGLATMDHKGVEVSILDIVQG